MPSFAIETHALGKAYRLYSRPRDQLFELLTGRSRHREHWAVRALNLLVPRGETLGIIGRNGSGKSTALQLLAGTLSPTCGTVQMSGRVGTVLELGAAFHREFTGRENVIVSGAAYGLSRSQILKRLDDIEAFADLGAFFDRPVRTYSSGMYVRLAFATASHVDADVLLIDEALAVGDVGFQHRCMHRFNELQSAGKTIVVVSHNPEAIKTLCTRVLLLDNGLPIALGNPADVVNRYLALLQTESRAPSMGDAVPSNSATHHADPDGQYVVTRIDRSDGRFGSGTAHVLGVELFDSAGRPTRQLLPGALATIAVSIRFHQPLDRPIVGVTLRNALGVDITRTNTLLEDAPLGPVIQGEVITCRFRLVVPELAPGAYSISPAAADGTLRSYQMCDWIENALIFELGSVAPVHGQMRLPWSVETFRTSAATPNLEGELSSGAGPRQPAELRWE